LEAKLDDGELTNANISVCIDDVFLKLLDTKGDVVFKWQGEERCKIAAKDIWDKIVQNAWKSGDPGILNIGLANTMNTISYQHDLIGTNPCGEQWMSAYDSCILGAINLHTHVINGDIDWDTLEETVATGVRFLDNILDQNTYPLPIIQEVSQKHRRIGLGVMGLHDMLLELGLKYSTEAARNVVDKVMGFIKRQAYHTSITLAVEKGSFHAFDANQHVKTGFVKKHLSRRHHRLIMEHGLRNCALLTAPPTGTISIVAGCSSGIEPLFMPIYKRKFNKQTGTNTKNIDQTSEIIVHPLLKRFLGDGRSIDHFQSAHDISPEDHLAMQVVCQKHVDGAISKTVNIPADFSVEQLSVTIRKHIGNLKGVTVYRDGSRSESPLTPIPLSEAKKYLEQFIEEAAVNDCPSGKCDILQDKKGADTNE
jgi:ribonucleoside-diphosphate reductase alpha chain